MPSKYLLDTNVFIQSKNFEYRFDFCGGFWDWIKAGHADNRLFSCGKVYEELKDGDTKKKCPAKEWADGLPATFFIPDLADAAVMQHYASLMNWAANQSKYKPAARRKFADPQNADPFLVSVAKHYGLVLVTHEVASEDAKNRIPIQSAAKMLGVTWTTLYDLLSIHAKTTFAYHSPP
jgi:hypothetical protein